MAHAIRTCLRLGVLLGLASAGCATRRASLQGQLLPELRLVDLAREVGAERAPRVHPSAAPPPVTWSAPVSEADAIAFELALEVEAYAAGVITTVAGHFPISEHEVISLRAGWNETDRHDFGEHDDEDGGGPGVGAGFRYYVGERYAGWLFGCRVDVWFLDIDWADDGPPGPPRSGSSDVVVLQPTIEAGYCFPLGEHCRLDLTLALGSEMNLDTDGEEVGEGGILLGGLGLAWGF